LTIQKTHRPADVRKLIISKAASVLNQRFA
jgi:hypothetical protein